MEEFNVSPNQACGSSLTKLIRLSLKENTTSNMSETMIVKLQDRSKAKQHIPKREKKNRENPKSAPANN